MHNQKKCPLFWRFLYVLGGVLLLSLAATHAAQPDRDGQQIIVQFKAAADDGKIKDKIEKRAARVKKHLNFQDRANGKGALVVLETAEPAAQAVEKFRNDPDVEFAEPDGVVHHQTDSAGPVLTPDAVANDTYYTSGYLWGL
ncbi:MAG TPA: hypothetical protein VJ063_13685, partial [Verrucomicrobiae bacterium]|nr:hypothetical protein [Verrucomicrobiae bacterium]